MSAEMTRQTLRHALRRKLQKFLLASLQEGRVPKPPLTDNEARLLGLISVRSSLDQRSLGKLLRLPREQVSRLSNELAKKGLCKRTEGRLTPTADAEAALEVFALLRFPESEEILTELAQYPAFREFAQTYDKVVSEHLEQGITKRLAESSRQLPRPPSLEDYLDAASVRLTLAEGCHSRIPYEQVRKELKLA